MEFLSSEQSSSLVTPEETAVKLDTLHPSPLPSSSNSISIEKKNFDYIKCPISRNMISTAYEAVNILNLWNFMKEDILVYASSDNPNIDLIYEKICQLGYDEHTEFSFEWTMKSIQTIAQHGEEEFMRPFLNNK
jgi:hypothetical protein